MSFSPLRNCLGSAKISRARSWVIVYGSSFLSFSERKSPACPIYGPYCPLFAIIGSDVFGCSPSSRGRSRYFTASARVTSPTSIPAGSAARFGLILFLPFTFSGVAPSCTYGPNLPCIIKIGSPLSGCVPIGSSGLGIEPSISRAPLQSGKVEQDKKVPFLPSLRSMVAPHSGQGNSFGPGPSVVSFSISSLASTALLNGL